MPQRLISFLVVWILTFNGEIFGQKNPQNFQGKAEYRGKIVGRKETNSEVISKISLEKKPIYFYVKHSPTWPVYYPSIIPSGKIDIRSCWAPVEATYIFRLSPTTYNESIGFFCKKELQLDKITSIPIRFRLGSLDYVNYLEKKPNASTPR